MERSAGKDIATWTDADRKVAAWVVDGLRQGDGFLDTRDRAKRDHLRNCPTLRVASFDASDGTYGCDTGCEYACVEGRVICDHDTEGAEFEIGEFGDLERLFADLATR